MLFDLNLANKEQLEQLSDTFKGNKVKEFEARMRHRWVHGSSFCEVSRGVLCLVYAAEDGSTIVPILHGDVNMFGYSNNKGWNNDARIRGDAHFKRCSISLGLLKCRGSFLFIFSWKEGVKTLWT